MSTYDEAIVKAAKVCQYRLADDECGHGLCSRDGDYLICDDCDETFYVPRNPLVH